MDYKRIYDTLCSRGKSRPRSGYDQHHIVPRAHGGTDDKSNLTHLTRKEHILAHKLLYKLTGDVFQKIACNALPYAEKGAAGSTSWKTNPAFLETMGMPIAPEVRRRGQEMSVKLRKEDPEHNARVSMKMAATKSGYIYRDKHGREFQSVYECAKANGVARHYVENGVRRGHHGFTRRPRVRPSEPD